MLGMAVFKSLVKENVKEYFEPIGRILFEAGIKQPNPLNPQHAWMLKGPMLQYVRWMAGMRLMRQQRPRFDDLPHGLKKYAKFACDFLSNQCFEISGAMRTHQLKLADRQCSMNFLSQRIQDAVVMLCTSLFVARSDDETTQLAGEVACNDLYRRLTGRLPDNRDFRQVTHLGAWIAEEGWQEIEGVEPDPIMMRYSR